VVQAVYRGILLATVHAPFDDAAEDADLETRQKTALASLIVQQQRFLKESPVPAVQAVRDATKAVKDAGGVSEQAAWNLLNSEVEDLGALEESINASDDYDDALAFILGHEIGHTALNHRQRLANGENRKDLENEADQFGALLVILTRNRNVQPKQSMPPGAPQIVGQLYEGCAQGGWASGDVNRLPTGHKSFFAYGSSFAGFDSLGPVAANLYPSIDDRARSTRMITETAYYAISAAQSDLGDCDSDSAWRAATAKDPVARQTARINELKKDLVGETPGPIHASDVGIDGAVIVWSFEVHEAPLSIKLYSGFVQRMSHKN
jgi:hypothetical protein